MKTKQCSKEQTLLNIKLRTHAIKIQCPIMLKIMLKNDFQFKGKVDKCTSGKQYKLFRS